MRRGNNYSGARWAFARRGSPGFGHRQQPAPGPLDPHRWHCPDCGQPCGCTDPLVRAAPHERCGKAPS